MLGSVELRSRLGVQFWTQLRIGWGAGDSWFGLAGLRAQFGSVSSSWCLGSGQDSARLGLEARPGSRLGAWLRDLRSAWIGAQLDSSRFGALF